MKPIKFVWILIAVLCFASVNAYTIIHNETFDYNCLSNNCTAYGWANLTSGGAGITGMQVDGLKAIFTYSGSLRGVAHKLNNVPSNYCINYCGNYSCTKPANFSIRVNVWQDGGAIFDVDDFFHFGIGMGAGYTSTQQVRFKMNGSSGVGDSKMYWHLIHDGGVSLLILNHTPDNTPRQIQYDFEMEQDTSPVTNQQIRLTRVYIDGIYTKDASMVFPLSANCFNATWWRYRNDGAQTYRIDDLYVVQYADNEPFLSPLANLTPSGNVSMVECNDTLDNDGDGYIDTSDPQCTFIGDNDESPYDDHECNDTIDNDADGLVDYPDDPACTDAADPTESPQNFYMCNDGVDNDGDGATDFPDDLGCIGYNDNDELPKQGSWQPEDTCAVASACITKDSFLYVGDDLSLHDWTYDFDFVGGISNITKNCTYSSGCGYYQTTNLLGFGGESYDVLITYPDDQPETFTQTLTLNRQFTNANTYNSAVFKYQFIVERSLSITNESIYLYLRNNNTILATTRIDFRNAPNTYKTQALIYTTSGGNYYLAATAYLNDLTDGILTLYIVADQQNGSYTLSYSDETSGSGILGDMTQYYFNYVSVPDNLQIYTQAEDISVYLTEVYAYGAIDSSSATCTQFTKPYYLKEDFNYGLISNCGWVTTSNVVVYGELDIDVTFASLDAYKQLTEIINQDKFRYVTIEFDADISSTQANDVVLTIFSLDTSGNTITQLYWKSNGDLYVVPDKTPELLTNTIQDQYVSYKLVLDLIDEKYKLFIDNVDYTSTDGIPFYDSDLDTETMRYFSISSQSSNYKLDNIKVYVSDQNGGIISGSGTPAQRVIKNDILGLWFKNTTKCTSDDDCASGLCMSYNTCSQFNFKACDEAGLPRGNWCVIKLNILNSLLNLKDLMLENFLLLIVFILLIMIAVYMAIMFRRG